MVNSHAGKQCHKPPIWIDGLYHPCMVMIYFIIVLPTLHLYSSEFPCVTLVDHIEHTVFFPKQ